ncbi:Protein-glutamate methylesterase/protein-glutamine glutaminase [Pseudomonas brassicacearum]|nr:Protein-glutamate methylesterase/protein-glutamine glutaminase [Pseudomonas brassicacearum]
MSQTATLLVIDDEPQIRKFLRISLSSQGYKVLEAGTGAEGLAQAALNKPDLLVLDLGLPDMDGQQVLREFRQWSTVPVLVLSVRASEAQKVEALDNGANDYVTKPFGIQEFLARVRALLRQAPAGEPQEAALKFGPLTVDLAYRRVLLDDTEVALTRKEYAVLAQLARHPGRVITQQQLLKDIWGPTHTEDSHYLRIVVGHLRQKLADDPTRPRFIVTEAGVGYRLLGRVGFSLVLSGLPPSRGSSLPQGSLQINVGASLLAKRPEQPLDISQFWSLSYRSKVSLAISRPNAISSGAL